VAFESRSSCVRVFVRACVYFAHEEAQCAHPTLRRTHACPLARSLHLYFILFLAQVRAGDDGVFRYVLLTPPIPRDEVVVTLDEDDECVFRLEPKDGSVAPHTLRAPTPEECSEWVQILSNPHYNGRVNQRDEISARTAQVGRARKSKPRRGPKPKRPPAVRSGGWRRSESPTRRGEEHDAAHDATNDDDGGGGGGDDEDHHREGDADEHDDEREPADGDASGEYVNAEGGDELELDSAARAGGGGGDGDGGDGDYADGQGTVHDGDNESSSTRRAVVMHCPMSKEESAMLIEDEGLGEGRWMFRALYDDENGD
jgi:hypothetical protein